MSVSRTFFSMRMRWNDTGYTDKIVLIHRMKRGYDMRDVEKKLIKKVI